MELLNAYIDESVHDDHGLYVIAAVLARPELRSSVADALRGTLPMDRRPHWHIEDDATRAKLAAVVGTLDIDARAYGCRFETSRRTEAARARAIGWFLVDLDVPLDELVLDRRERSQDRKDKRLLANVLPKRRPITYRHATTAAEPLLWVADVVAGAVAATWLRRSDHLEVLHRALSVCELEPG